MTDVNETISSSANSSKPNATAARAASVAYPLPQCSRASRQPISTAGVKVRLEARLRETYETDALCVIDTFDRPQPPSALRDLAALPFCQSIALLAPERGREVAHHLRVGIEGCKWFEVSFAPLSK